MHLDPGGTPVQQLQTAQLQSGGQGEISGAGRRRGELRRENHGDGMNMGRGYTVTR